MYSNPYYKVQQAWWDRLSAQERRVLQLTAKGLTSNDDIAGRMQISSHTVEEYWERICVKLHANNKTHAVAMAIQVGLV